MAGAGGAIKLALFQAVNQPNRFGGIYGGIYGPIPFARLSVIHDKRLVAGIYPAYSRGHLPLALMEIRTPLSSIISRPGKGPTPKQASEVSV